MGVSELSIALYNEYTPTGAYSVEFRDKAGETIAEPFFALPPESYSVTEEQRSSLQKTLYGGYIGDNGNDFKYFNVSGKLNFYHIMNPENPLAISDVPGSTNGLSEFFKLRYIIMRYRDYTMSKNGTVVAPPLIGLSMQQARALKIKVEELLSSKSGALSDKIDVIWHSYDMDDHFYVRVNRFTYSQDSKDVFTVKYDIEFEAYQIDTKMSGIINSGKIKEQPHEEIANIEDQLRNIATDTLPSEIVIQNYSEVA